MTWFLRSAMMISMSDRGYLGGSLNAKSQIPNAVYMVNFIFPTNYTSKIQMFNMFFPLYE